MKATLSAYYAASIGSLSFVPFLSPLLAAQTGDDRIVAATLALLPAGRLLGGTAWSWIADVSGPKPILRLTTAAAALLGLAVLLAPGPGWLAIALLLFAIMRAPQFPIVDALALRALGTGYGSARAWGSLAYLLLVLAAGSLRTLHPGGPVAAAVALLVLAAALAWRLPAPQAAPRALALADVRRLLADPGLRAVLLVALFQGMTITAYDTLFSLHIERLELGAGVASVAIALGVAGEIAVMAASPALLARFGPRRVLIAATLSGLPRWAITAVAVSPAWLVPTQALHALGFGAFWVAATRLIADRAPEELASTAQSLLPASGWGVGYLASMAIAATLLPVGGTPAVFAASLGIACFATVAAFRLP
ncbi:MAG: hypothetical protein EP330_19175 [Deltaproteobacteria bacterium]|nr:MAG: hypothetical protein EP330_19175 [Deltaproteobacteria bacterium]